MGMHGTYGKNMQRPEVIWNNPATTQYTRQKIKRMKDKKTKF